MSQSRQLAAIMFTDIVGYTALMGKDSAKALELVRISKEIQKPIVEKNHGQWLKEMGDGALVKFGTALDAVNCAIGIQELARAKFDGKLRIGIHSGDITLENDDVYGDGVNVASRLESIADPGGIYISDAIEKAIQGQTNVQAKYIGEIKLKNVAYGVRTYAVQGVGMPIPEVKADKELSGHLWAEVQRRGVIRAAVTYVAAGLLLVLLLREAQNWITLPDWSLTAVLAGLLVCFPIAMYLAWNYERSPEGFVQTSSQESWRNPYSTARRKLLTGSFVIASLMLIIVFMYFYPGFQSSGQKELAANGPVSESIEKSIAVLPFRDISPNKDQEWFSDGVMEAILDHITKIPGLKVTSRTSVMRYRNSDKSIPEIAEELGVSYLLEGGVQVFGDQVRISAQLIDLTDQHLWSEQYDQPYSDIFKIQSEVAENIASVIEVSIGSEVKERMFKVPTDNIEAYNYLLKARVTNDTWVERWELYERAIELDPEFAEAYAYYGDSWYNQYTWASVDTLTNTQIMNKSLRLLKRALELDPNLAFAHKNLGDLYCYGLLDLKNAGKEYQIAQSLAPSDPHMTNPEFLMATGRFREALAAVQKQIESDPINSYLYGAHAMALFFDDQIVEAVLNADNYLRRSNFGGNIVYGASRVYLWAGEYQKVVQLYEQHPLGIDFARFKANAAIAYFKLNQSDKSGEIVESLKNRKTGLGSPAYCLGLIYAQMGEIDTAFEWLEKAYEERQGELYWLKQEPPFEPLYVDPRWQEMLNKVGFPD
jgi:TolB-like protein/class 3 adenylate cyclase